MWAERGSCADRVKFTCCSSLIGVVVCGRGDNMCVVMWGGIKWE